MTRLSNIWRVPTTDSTQVFFFPGFAPNYATNLSIPESLHLLRVPNSHLILYVPLSPLAPLEDKFSPAQFPDSAPDVTFSFPLLFCTFLPSHFTRPPNLFFFLYPARLTTPRFQVALAFFPPNALLRSRHPSPVGPRHVFFSKWPPFNMPDSPPAPPPFLRRWFGLLC